MNTRRWVTLGLLTAIAFLLMFLIEFPLLPAHPFLKYDPSEIPALIGALLLGPTAGVVVEFGKNILFLMAGRSEFGWLGILPNFLAGATMVMTAGWVYATRPSPRRALFGMLLGTVLMSAVLAVTNYYFFLPILWGIPPQERLALVLGAITPFNLLKGSISSVAAYAVKSRLPIPIKRTIERERVSAPADRSV